MKRTSTNKIIIHMDHMDMSQNEVSVIGSKIVTLREKTDTSF